MATHVRTLLWQPVPRPDSPTVDGYYLPYGPIAREGLGPPRAVTMGPPRALLCETMKP